MKRNKSIRGASKPNLPRSTKGSAHFSQTSTSLASLHTLQAPIASWEGTNNGSRTSKTSLPTRDTKTAWKNNKSWPFSQRFLRTLSKFIQKRLRLSTSKSCDRDGRTIISSLRILMKKQLSRLRLRLIIIWIDHSQVKEAEASQEDQEWVDLGPNPNQITSKSGC